MEQIIVQQSSCLAPSLPIYGLPVYQWYKLPRAWKAFYDKEEFLRWCEAYGEEGDRLPF